MAGRSCAQCGSEIDGRRRLCETCSDSWRWCARCERVRPLAAFRWPGGRLLRWCVDCTRGYQRTRGGREDVRRYHFIFHLRRKFGISREEAERLAGVRGCEVCGLRVADYDEARRKLHVDHCHRTDRVRGVVCVRCNHALGVLDDERPEWLGWLERYLARARV